MTIADATMVIGCQHHAIDDWWRFDDHKIGEMAGDALDFWRVHKPVIFGLICADGRFTIPQQEVEA